MNPVGSLQVRSTARWLGNLLTETPVPTERGCRWTVSAGDGVEDVIPIGFVGMSVLRSGISMDGTPIIRLDRLGFRDFSMIHSS